MELTMDGSEFALAADQMAANFDQVPFALSRAMNDAAFDARQRLIDETWPQAITMRNAGFMAQALHVERSDKYNLVVSITDQLGRGNLEKHADGGTRLPRGAHMAIPTAAVTIGSHGVSPGQKPMALANKVVKGNGIYQWQGKGKHRRLVLMYVLATHVVIKKDVPFREEFSAAMNEAVALHFPTRLQEAMATRFR